MMSGAYHEENEVRESMGLRLAETEDLPEIRRMFEGVIAWMDGEGIRIWDEVYPSAAFPADIDNRRLYLLEDGGEMLGAFALSAEDESRGRMGWEKREAGALYLERLAVSAARPRQGIGKRLIRQAAALARDRGAEYLRLLVVDYNRPAIRLYEKCGFRRAEGLFDKPLGEDLILHEFGYELDLVHGLCPAETYYSNPQK